MNRLKANWQKMDDGRWGVCVRGNLDSTTRLAGTEIDVRKRDGSSKVVRLGRRVAQWNAGRASVYEVDRG